MLKGFADKLKELGISKKTPVALAVSGGADSMALCHLAHSLGLKFTAIIVNHNYRKNSTKEAAAVKKYLLEKFGIKAVILTNKKAIPKTGIEEFLREVRYNLIFAHCKKHGLSKILTAHHADDQIETFLMRLERGAGLDGLTGMKDTSQFTVNGSQFTLIRPLLSFSKDDLISYLKINKIKWWEDKTNKDTKLTRNNIRATLEGFSDYQLLRKRLTTVMENLERTRNFIEHEQQKALKNLVKQTPKTATLDTTGYSQLHEELRLRVLRDIIKKYSRTGKDIRISSLRNLDNTLLSKGFSKTSLHGISINKKGAGSVIFS